MKLNNSIKLSIANFALFWKIFLYKLIALLISGLLALPIVNVLNESLKSSGLFSSIISLFTNSPFQSLTSWTNQIYDILTKAFGTILDLAQSNVLVLIYLAILILIILPFLLKLSDVPASESAYSYMSSLYKNSFVLNFVNMLDKSAGYSILRTLLQIPFLSALAGGTYGILSLSNLSAVMAIIAPLIWVIFVILMLALNSSFLNGWAPSIVVFNCGAVKAFGKGFKAVKRNFLSVLSSFVVVMVFTVGLIYVFGVYSLIATVPFLALILAVFGQVLFFESQGMNYYISPDNIVTPRKLECADSISEVRFII